MRKKKTIFNDAIKVHSNEAGSQWIEVADLERNAEVQKTIKRLYKGFIAEQKYRAGKKSSMPLPQAYIVTKGESTTKILQPKDQPPV